MFKELIDKNGYGGREYPELNGAYVGVFKGVKMRRRATFETRNDPAPTLEDVFVFEFEVDDPDLDEPILVSKWVRKPPRLSHPSKGKSSNLYKMLAALYGVLEMTDEQMEAAEEFVEQAVGREYQLTLQTKPSGWIEIVHVAPVRKPSTKRRKSGDDEEIPF